MGNRALVLFSSQLASPPISPIAVYLHWSGSRVPTLLEEWWALMQGRRGDLDYGIARFIGVAHVAIPGNLSLGIWTIDPTQPPGSHSPGDAGVFVVDVGTGIVTRHFSDWPEVGAAECDAPPSWDLGGDQNGNGAARRC